MTAETTAVSVRSDWIRVTVDACQVFLGSECEDLDTFVANIHELAARAPSPATPLEAMIFRGLIAEIMLRELAREGLASQECVKVLASNAPRVHDPASRRPATHPKIKLALALMSASFQRPHLTLREVAAAVHLTPWHLSRLMRKETGVGFPGYIRALRLNHAATLLRTSSRSIKEVAAEVGYKYGGDFSKHFAKQFGVTPHLWRRRHARK